MPKTVVRHESEHLYASEPSSDAGRSLGNALLRLRRVEQLLGNRALRSTGLSTMEFNALRYLVQASRDHRDMSPKDVIVMLETSSASVTNIIDRLVTRGYVTRVDHPTDRRARYLHPTDLGVQLVDNAYHDHHAIMVEAIDGLEERDAMTAATAIARITERLDALNATGADVGDPLTTSELRLPQVL